MSRDRKVKRATQNGSFLFSATLHEQIQRRQAERMRSLHDFSALLSETDTQQAQQNELSLLADETPTTRTNAPRQTATVPSQMQNSMNARVGNYAVIIEGVTDEGRIVHAVSRIR